MFGNELGERIMTVKTAWRNATRQAAISDLRFHDLRHEAGSRFLEAGWPLSHVREMLGHANISTTDTYLNVSLKGLQESMHRLDDGRMCKKFASSSLQEAEIDYGNELHTTGNSLIN